MLGITPQGDVPLIDTVADALAGRRMLLVVDNCEHVLERRAGTVGGDPRPAGNVRILATSREALGVDGEAIVTVPPLARRRRRHIRCGHAVRRSGPRGPPGFELQRPDRPRPRSPRSAQTVDGLPLGIELAAARMAAMSAVEVRDRLADRFRLLQRFGTRARSAS